MPSEPPSEGPHTPHGSAPESAFQVRTQRAEELAAVMALGDLAFGPQEGIGALIEALQADGCFSGQSYVALAGDRIVGHTMLTRCFLDTEDRLLTIPVLSPLAVHPDLQHRGVGRALVRHALAEAEVAGAVGVVLEGDPAYYSRLGFQPAEPWGLLRPSARIPRPAFQWVRFPAHQPWMRGRVVYPEVFWQQDAVGLRGLRGPASSLEVTTVTLGARDLPGLVRFYGALLGREVPGVEELAGQDWVAVRDDDGGIAVAVQLEPEQERVRWPAGVGEQHMQVHLEVRVCLDPAGHPFCLWVVH